jgi:hypothetical protein
MKRPSASTASASHGADGRRLSITVPYPYHQILMFDKELAQFLRHPLRLAASIGIA